jgi:hypothetical protein
VANEIRIPIIGEDRASGPMREVGRSADVAAAGARRLADALDSQKRAADAAARADLSLAKANAILDVTEHKINAEQDRVRQKIKTDLQAAGGPGLGRALVSGSALRSLFGGGAGGAGGAASAAAGAAPAASPLLDFLGSPAGAGSIAAAAGPVASLVDALLGQGLGSGGALLGGLLANTFRPSALAPGLTNIKRTLSTVTQSFAPSLGLMFAQFAKTFQGLAPVMAKFFAATLPFMKQFLTLALTAAKTILPAMTQALEEMVKSGALKAMTQGFVYVIQGIAGFIKAIGPGMKAGAEIFRAAMDGVRGILVAFGATLGWLGRITQEWLSHVRADWDQFRHDTAAVFAAVVTAAKSAWNILITGVKDAITTVVSVFFGLQPRVLHALFGLGHTLYAFARAALNEMWSGFKSIGGAIISWIGNFASSIWNKVKSFFGIASPSSVFYDIGKNLMLGLFHGIKDHAHHAASAVAGATGAVAGQAGSAQRYARSILGAYGWAGQWGALNAVAMRESGWSLTARNPSSGAYGIAQFINGPSEYYQYGGNPGTVAGQVIAFFNYIRLRYGNPSAAWAHELNFGWYDKGGWLPPGLSLAYNATGRAEQVIPNRGGGGVLTVVVKVDPVIAAVTPDRRLGQHIGQHVTAAIRGGMALYPAGVTPR